MSLSFGAGVRDSLSNLAASLGTGRDKAAHDAFAVVELGRAQVEAMYRGDWLARKVVDIVPYDSVRAWRSWSGHRADIARVEAAERRLGLRKAVQRAMLLGRLYGGGALIIGDGEPDPAALARPLDEPLPRGGLRFLHAVSRWQLGASAIELDPLSLWCGEPRMYTLSSPGQPVLELHPSRVVRFLGNPLPDPSLAGAPWSDSVRPRWAMDGGRRLRTGGSDRLRPSDQRRSGSHPGGRAGRTRGEVRAARGPTTVFPPRGWPGRHRPHTHDAWW